MKIYIYLDESGSIHKNSKAHHFAIGGYMVYGNKYASSKVINKYKRINKKHKEHRCMNLNNELKTRNMTMKEKIEIIEKIQKIDNFYDCAIVFDKTNMRKSISTSNLFFNYGVKILFQDVILPLLPEDETYEFLLSIDNRNISVGDKKDLAKFLQTTYCCYDYTFSVTYYDSATHYGIQLADLIVNTMYMRFKDRKFIEPVLDILDTSKFRLNLFPGYAKYGRMKKIDFKMSELTKV